MSDAADPQNSDSRPEYQPTQVGPPSGATQLVEILDRYMTDLKDGKNPDREKLLSDNPEFATQLRECLDGIDFIHQTSHSPDETPTQIDDFRIVREVGRGGMGVVYEAEQISLKRRVALKVLRFGGITDRDAVERFQREAETVAGLDFAHIVPVYAVGSQDGIHYYAMQFIEGRSLAEVADRRGVESRSEVGSESEIGPQRIAEWGLQTARALAYAHQHGVIHRDVKPSNLILDPEGKLWLTDFGLARRDIDVTLSVAGALMGTPRYMSPEQAAASRQPIDHRTDIYSLGATLYELATGKPVFDADTPQGVITQILNVEPPSPRKLDPDLPRDLETIILKSLAKQPADRYATATDLADDLQAFLDDRPIRARQPSAMERGRRYLRRHRKMASAAGLSAAVMVLLIVGGWIAARSFQLARLGTVNFTTTGTNLTGEILDENGETVVPAFSVPTVEPLQLAAGNYSVRLWSDGVLSDTWPLEIDRGGEHSFEVHSRSRWLWPPKELNPTAYRQIDTIQRSEGGGEDILITSYERSDSDSSFQTRIRCLDGRNGKSAWPNDLILNLQTSPNEKDANAWAQQLSNPGILSDDLARLVQPLADLNGDGIRDLVFLSRSATSLLAVSGSDGTILWWSRNWPRLPDGREDKTGRWYANRSGAVLGWPVVADANNDGTRDIIACFFSGGATFSPENGSRIRTGAEFWIASISGRTGETLWRRPLQVKLESALFSSDEAKRVRTGCRLQVASVNEGQIVVGVVEQKVIAVDLSTGEEAWPPHDLGFDPAAPPICRDLDGDGHEELLLLRNHPQTDYMSMEAFALTQLKLEGPLWTVRFRPTDSDSDRREQADWFLADDLNEDGRGEVLFATGQFGEYDERGKQTEDRWCGIEAVDASSGNTIWQRQLTRTGKFVPPSIDRLIKGPDLNGDGFAEVFAAWMAPVGEQPWESQHGLRVEALSGKDGGTLWRWQREIGRIRHSPDPSGSLTWWQTGPDGWPLLVVPLAYARGGQHATYFLSASTGQLEHILSETYQPRVADVDGDGILDLFYQVSPQGAPRLLVLGGTPPESWKRLGGWTPVSDLDGDGSGDLVNKTATAAASGTDQRILWNAPPIGPSSTPTDLQLALPMPVGDLDGDGTADLIKFHSVPGSSLHAQSYKTIACYSGKSGELVWVGADIGMGNTVSSGGAVGTHYNYPAVDWTDLDGDRVAELIVVHHPGDELDSSQRVMLSVVDGRTGTLRWQTPIVRGGFAARPDPYGRIFPDLNGDGVGDAAVWAPMQAGSPHCVIRAIDGKTGTQLWTAAEGRVGNDGDILWPRPAVGDLDGDGHPEVVAVHHEPYDRERKGYQSRLVVLDGRTGEKKWIHEWWGNIDILPPLLVDFEGEGTPSVCVGLNEEGRNAIQIFSSEGELQTRIPLVQRGGYHESVFLWYTADVDGDGRAELLFEREGDLVACRGSAENVLWSWPLPDDDSMLLTDSLRERSGEIAVWSGTMLYGLDGETGQPRWTCEGSYEPNLGASNPPRAVILPDEKSADLPRVVFLPPSYSDSWATVAQRATAVSDDGSKVFVTPQAEVYPGLGESPPPRRPLPWAGRGMGPSEQLELCLIQSGLAGFAILLLPVWLIKVTLQSGSWSTGLLLAGYAALWALGPLPQAATSVVALALPVWLLIRSLRTRSRNDVCLGMTLLVLLAATFAGVHLLSPHVPGRATAVTHKWGSLWWLDALVLEAVLMGLVSSVGFIFWWLIGRSLRAGHWREAGQLMSVSIGVASILAVVILLVDTPVGRIAPYSWRGWYLIWFSATYLIGFAWILKRGSQIKLRRSPAPSKVTAA